MNHIEPVNPKGLRLASWLLIAICFVAAGIPALAQLGRGTVIGIVTDSSGAAVPGATLRLTEVNTGSVYDGKSSAQGNFTFPELLPGRYALKVTAHGFETFTHTGFSVEVGSSTTVNTMLKPGSTNVNITVNGEASHLETQSAEVGTTVPSKLIMDLPLQFDDGPRNPIQFVTLTPGYTGVMDNSPTQLGGFKLNGGQEGGQDVLVDGASIEFASANLQINYGVSVEAVQEFKVVTNTFDAEYGRLGGGVVNLTTKSGANSLHGAFYDMLRNRVLDANTWINDHNGVGKPIDTQNDFGAQISGPVYLPWLYNGHNKTFFMFNYEGWRFDTGSNSLQSAPTEAMLSGDFSSLLTQSDIDGQIFPAYQLYNYATCTGVNQGQACQPFVGNIITTPEDPVAANMMKYLPHSTETQPYLNYVQIATNPQLANIYEVRIDQNIGAKQKINGSYDYDWIPNAVYDAGEPLNTSATNQRTRYVRLGYDYIFGPNLLNHFNAGFSRRYRQEDSGEGSYGGDWPKKIGLGGVEQTTFPQISWDYPDEVNLPSNGADQFADNTWQYDDTVLWEHGRHNFKFGGETRLQEFNINILTGTSGEFGFGTGPTSTPSVPDSGFGFASFYMGAASSGDIYLPEILGWRVKYYSAFAQDHWQITPKLTADLGLRWELTTPVTEAHDEMSYMNPTVPNPGAGDLPGAYVFQGHGAGRLGTNTSQTTFKDGFGPRVGLAYQLYPGTVIRAGYGIYYDDLKVGGFGENDSAGFTSSYTYPTPASLQTPAVVLSQITSYPGPLPPFINPTVQNGQDPTVILSKVARPGTSQTWTLDVQQQLPGNTIVDITYVGDHGDHLQAFLHDPNQGNPADQSRGACLEQNIDAQGAGTPCVGQTPVPSPYVGFSGTVAQALRPFPQYESAQVDTATMADPFGDYTYDALQIMVQKRLTHGLTVLSSYTWSKNLTNADSEYPINSSYEANDVGGALNVYNLKVEKGLSQYDTPQSLVVSYTYALPFGRGREFASKANALVNGLIGGWQIAGSQTYESGNPLAVTEGNWTSGIFAGPEANLGANARPNIVPGVDPNGFHGGKFIYGQSTRWNPAAFTYAPDFTFGDAPRDFGNVRSFANLNENFNFEKQIPTHSQRVHVIFRIDCFDAFNRHQFSGFNNSVTGDTASNTSSGFGQSSGTTGPFGGYQQSGTQRNLQAELRVTY